VADSHRRSETLWFRGVFPAWPLERWLALAEYRVYFSLQDNGGETSVPVIAGFGTGVPSRVYRMRTRGLTGRRPRRHPSEIPPNDDKVKEYSMDSRTICSAGIRSSIRILVALGFLIPALASAQDAPPPDEVDDRPGVAVLQFDNGGSFGPDQEDFEALEVGLQHMLLTELAQNSALRIVERRALKELLEEQDLAATGRVDAQTAARIGRLVGARWVILGGFTDIWGEFNINARIVDVETSEVPEAWSVRDDREAIYELLVDLASQITDGVDLPPLPVEVREAREQREIPSEAVLLFSRAQTYEDFGDQDRAVEVYQRIVNEFPQMTEAQEALEQISSS